ncbi:methylamine dehydrogenase accessory protein MauD [Neomegalonema sp.]|uniref:methylamine dehydrogenase accessory protein MauD n=1 Tax=Neomegalonema sp. TaxID=2039713 RepID=UPI00260A3CD5|nr:methylamine dehydrogenase accessory protein MauD [Neomegalonema sp.]MDD2867343.1 methylamine dehydrogenase accessory protein MauD [Neomegalonema sp.]
MTLQILIASNILLWLCLIGLGLVTFGLLRQVGLLHERSAPMGAMITDHGPDIGDLAPQFDLVDYFNQPARIGGENPKGRLSLLMFTAPSCPVCEKMFPILKSIADAERLDVTLISDGPADEHERFLAKHRLGSLRYVVSAEVGMRFQVGKIPYGVLLDSSGVIRSKGLVNTREHLESLLEADKTGFASLQELIADYKDKAAVRAA